MKEKISFNEFIEIIQWLSNEEFNIILNSLSGDMIKNARDKKKIYIESINDYTPEKIKNIPKSANIYLIKNNRNGFTKIGWSKNPALRERTLQSQEPELELILVLECLPKLVEANLHNRFKDKRVRGEWFNLDENDINFLKNLQY